MYNIELLYNYMLYVLHGYTVYTHIYTHKFIPGWSRTCAWGKACSSAYLGGERSGLHGCVLFCVGQDRPQGSSQVLLVKVWCFAHQRCQRHDYLHLHSCKVLRQEEAKMDQVRDTQRAANGRQRSQTPGAPQCFLLPRLNRFLSSQWNVSSTLHKIHIIV